jgi:hypothetical protein
VHTFPTFEEIMEYVESFGPLAPEGRKIFKARYPVWKARYEERKRKRAWEERFPGIPYELADEYMGTKRNVTNSRD